MKKTIAILVLMMMLCTTVFGAVNAGADDAATLDSSLIIHWDFEGADLATQLANKATAGGAKDSIILVTDGTSSKIENGEITIGDKHSESLQFFVDTANGVGNKLVETITDSYTLYLRFKITENPKDWATLFATSFNGYKAETSGMRERIYFPSSGTAKLRWNHNSAHDFTVSDPTVFPNEYCAIAVVVEKNADGTYNNTLWQTYDDWGEMSMFAKLENATGAESVPVMGETWNILLGGRMWNQLTGGDQESKVWGMEFVYDDIRIYNKALTEAEVKTINAAPATPVDTTPVDTTPVDTTPVDTTPDSAADTTSDTDAPAEGGCGSSIGAAAILVPVMGMGAVVIGRRKRR